MRGKLFFLIVLTISLIITPGLPFNLNIADFFYWLLGLFFLWLVYIEATDPYFTLTDEDNKRTLGLDCVHSGSMVILLLIGLILAFASPTRFNPVKEDDLLKWILLITIVFNFITLSINSDHRIPENTVAYKNNCGYTPSMDFIPLWPFRRYKSVKLQYNNIKIELSNIARDALTN